MTRVDTATVRTVFKAPLLISSQGFLLVFLIGRCFKSGGDCNFKFSKMWSKPFDAPLHISENDEEDIDELYRNEIFIENN